MRCLLFLILVFTAVQTIIWPRIQFRRSNRLLLKNDTLTIVGVGDIMMGTNYPDDKLPCERRRLPSA